MTTLAAEASPPSPVSVDEVAAVYARWNYQQWSALTAAIVNDEWGEHNLCSLTACRDPLHPGPCKGWKHTLHSVAPGVYHTLEKARVEKANQKRLAKIAALKEAGKPIPKSLLKEITYGLPKPPPEKHIGKEAEVAGGEAHQAMKAVAKAAGVKVNEAPKVDIPQSTSGLGKTTLGQAVKKAAPEPKRPTLAQPAEKAAAKAQPTPGHRTPEKPVQRPTLAQTAGKKAAQAQPTPGHRTPEPPKKRVGLAETGTPAAKAQPTPGHREPVKPKPAEPELSPAAKTAMKVAHQEGYTMSKVHLAAYEPLTKKDFDSLPPATQDKIVHDLKVANGKLKDPKKLAAAKNALEKFTAGKPAKVQEPKVEKPASLTTAMKKAGLEASDHPDFSGHKLYAKQQANQAISHVTNGHEAVVDNPKQHPAVTDALAQAKIALYDQHLAQAEDKAKASTFHKVSDAKMLKKVTPAEAELLTQHAKEVFNHPGGGDNLALHNKQVEANKALIDLKKAISDAEAKDGKANEAKMGHTEAKAHVAQMTPYEINSIADSVLGPKAMNAMPSDKFLTIDAKAKEMADNAVTHALAAAGVQPHEMDSIKSDPAVASALADYRIATVKAHRAELVADAIDDHIIDHHGAALNSGNSINGVPLTAVQRVAVEAHKEQVRATQQEWQDKANFQLLQADHAHNALVTAIKDAKQKGANDFLDNLINSVGKTPQEIVDKHAVTPADAETIGAAYRKAWGATAKDAFFYGAKSSYYTKQKMLNHALIGDAKTQHAELTSLAGDVAIARAHAHALKAAEDELHAQGGVVDKDFATKVTSAMDEAGHLQQNFDTKLKAYQATVDTIRTDAGLKKRTIPKLDAAGVKSTAAESAHMSVVGYGSKHTFPEGVSTHQEKNAYAKNYLVSKLGDKFAQPHKDYSDKYEEKQAKAKAKAEKQLAQAAPEYAANKAAANAAGPKSFLVNGTKGELGPSGYPKPNQEVADAHGLHYAPNHGIGHDSGYPGYEVKQANKHAYVSSPEQAKAYNAALQADTTKKGQAAKEQFPWSIYNIVSQYSKEQGGEGNASDKAAGWKDALYSYTGSGYADINSELNKLTPGVTPSGAKIKKIDAAMAAAPPLKGDTVLWRGFGNASSVFSKSKWNDTNVAGMEWTARSFLSTSAKQTTAESFSGGSGPNSVVMRILVPEAMKVKGINAAGGAHESEDEIILQRGLRIRVVADYGVIDGRRRIDVEVVPNPYG